VHFFFKQLINKVIDQCEPGLIFYEKEGCVVGNKLTCERGLPETIIPTEKPANINDDQQLPDSDLPIIPPLNLEEICRGNPLGFLPNPDSCTTFIICVFEIGEVNACPSHIPIFDANRLICVQGKSVVFVLI
jgi:hypothetical protein